MARITKSYLAIAIALIWNALGARANCSNSIFDDDNCSNRLSNGAYIGIAIGIFVLILALSLFTNYTRRQRAQKANLAFMHNMQNQQGGGGYNPGGGGGYHPGGYNPGSGYNPGGGNAGAGYNPSPYTPNSAQNRYSAPNYPPPRVTTPPPGGMSYYQPPSGPPPSHETQFQNPENTYDPTNAPQVPPPSYQKN